MSTLHQHVWFIHRVSRISTSFGLHLLSAGSSCIYSTKTSVGLLCLVLSSLLFLFQLRWLWEDCLAGYGKFPFAESSYSYLADNNEFLNMVTAAIFHFRFIIATWTDQRINTLNEVFSGMRVIKMYVWEPIFRNLVSTLRR